ncbi:MAG: hypothetical protein O2816_16630 [Planctomycetota bacterium]|nr:hypothetical protein [Planctomycetota bacterium]
MTRSGTSLLIGLAVVAAVLFWGTEAGGELPDAATKRAPTPTRVEPTSADLVAGMAEEHPTPGAAPSETREEEPDTARTAVPEPPKSVLLFEHADHDHNFPGRRWFLDRGRYVAPDDFEGDQASTVRIPQGLRLVLYDADDFTGARVVLGPGQHNLAPYGFNDRASSALVLGANESLAGEVPPSTETDVVLYESRPGVDEPARSWHLPLEGDSSFYSSPGFFDPWVVSAVWVPTGIELTLFVEPEGRGPALVLGPGMHELATMKFDNKTCSVRLRREE